MKKIKTVLFMLPFFLFFGCPEPEPEPVTPEPEPEPVVQDNDETNGESEKALVKLQNDSQFKVDVYSDSLSSNLLCTLKPTETKTVESSESIGGTVFYVTYFQDVGVLVPWNDGGSSYIVANPKNGKTVTASIADPKSMSTNDCFVIFENESSSQIIFKQGSSELFPENDKSKTILSKGESGVYKISKNSFGNFPSFRVLTVANSKIDFPESFTKFESGKIFTIVVMDEGSETKSSVKSIAPFDIDTQKQMWTESIKPGYSIDCVRSAYNLKDGSFYAGNKIDHNIIYIETLDVYGNSVLHKEHTILNSASTEYEISGYSVIDAFQNSNGNYVLLFRVEFNPELFEYEADSYWYFLGVFDYSGESKKILPLTSAVKAEDIGQQNIWFYGNTCKGMIGEVSEDKYCIFGATYDSSKNMKFFSAIADFSETPNLEKHFLSSDSVDLSSGVYKAFTSSYFDGNNFYVSGYDNFDGKYSDAQIHRGVVYKFNSDLSEFSEVYSAEKTLFFGIAGAGEKYYVCGEVMGTSGDGNLYGAFLTSEMVTENSKPKKCNPVAAKGNAWFTQITITSNGIAVCGVNSSSQSEGDDYVGILSNFSSDGTKLWENEFTDYGEIISMSNNNIGTQLLHLRKGDSTYKIISTNLLGKEKY